MSTSMRLGCVVVVLAMALPISRAEPPVRRSIPLVRNVDDPAARAPLTFPRRQNATEEALRAELGRMPEITVGEEGLVKRGAGGKIKPPSFEMTADVLVRRADLAGLPLRMGKECKTDAFAAAALRFRSADLRTVEGADTLLARLEKKEFDHEFDKLEAIPALMQMLTPETDRTRSVLVWQLSEIRGKESTEALARLALFDISPDVRQYALEVLRDRSAADYRPVFLRGLRYPWPRAVFHAAEALVALGDRAALPALERIAREPDPEAPFEEAGRPGLRTRELVRINHLCTCLLCHAPDRDGKGMVRAAMPVSGSPLRPAREYYATEDAKDAVFVRAEFTYLRQDFSVSHSVQKHDAWPQWQRFDYVVRTRPLNDAERRRRGPNPAYREALDFAIAELKR